MPIAAPSQLDASQPPTRFRDRLRPQPAAGPSTLNARPFGQRQPNTTSADVTRLPSIRHLRVAFEETPPKLRELEQGWRARRKRVLDDVTQATQDRMTGSSYEGLGIGEARLDEGDDMVLSRQQHTALNTSSRPRPANAEIEPTQHIMTGPLRAVPIPAPLPTPPASPPIPVIRAVSPRTGSILPTARQHHHHELAKPILAHPLPPSAHPIPISRRSRRETIRVSPLEWSTELVISLELGKREIRIMRGGKRVAFGDRELLLDDQGGWGKTDWEEWEMVQALVDRVKRATPRVSLSARWWCRVT